MIRIISFFLSIWFLLPQQSFAQKNFLDRILPNKEESTGGSAELSSTVKQRLKAQIKKDLQFLASAKAAGRMTGTLGEQTAGMYIEKRLKDERVLPYGRNYRQQFKFIFGKTLTPETRFRIGENYLFIPEDAFPASFSAGSSDENFVLPDSKEPYGAWIIPLYDEPGLAHSPNFNWEETAYQKALYAQDRGATSVVLYDKYGSSYFPEHKAASKYPQLKIPVILLPRKSYDKYIKDMVTIQPYLVNIKYKNNYRNGTNILGYIDNKSATTVLITAYYDGLGKRVEGNSKVPEIYPGADGNASGVAGLIALSSVLKESGFTKYNYILAATSARYQESMGVQALLNRLKEENKKIAFVIDLNAIGRFKNTLIVNGAYTSPGWQKFLRSKDQIRINKDTELNRTGDFQVFLKAEIPTLSFTTGWHEDLHTPQDHLGKINYSGTGEIIAYIYHLIGQLNNQAPPLYKPVSNDPTQVKAIPTGRARQTNNFGINPDTAYTGIGLKVASVFKSQAAARAGLKPEDIVLQLNNVKINNEQEFIQASRDLQHGQEVRIKVKRGPTVQEFKVIF